MKRKLLIILLAVLGLLGGLTWWSGGLFPIVLLYGMPSASDMTEASDVVDFVKSHFSFTEKSKPMPSGWPIYCRAGPRGMLGTSPHTIIVYTVRDRQRQDEILDLVRQCQKERRLRSINVNFYRDENWISFVSPDGETSGGHREKEELIRSEKLK